MCVQCNVRQEIDRFSIDNSKRDGLQLRCRTCYSIYAREARLRYHAKRELSGPRTGMKQCPQCHVVLSVDSFSVKKGTRDGCQWRCKTCHAAAAKQARLRYLEERTTFGPATGLKFCSGCAIVHDIESFSRNKSTPDGRQLHCKTCDASRCAKAWRSDPTKYQDRSLRNNHKRRARLAGVETGSNVEIKFLRARDGNYCHYCGVALNFTPQTRGNRGDPTRVHIDHTVPISLGGNNTVDNVTLCCANCNLSKGSKLESEWLAKP